MSKYLLPGFLPISQCPFDPTKYTVFQFSPWKAAQESPKYILGVGYAFTYAPFYPEIIYPKVIGYYPSSIPYSYTQDLSELVEEHVNEAYNIVKNREIHPFMIRFLECQRMLDTLNSEEIPEDTLNLISLLISEY
jgi:hypothetical protein